MTFCVTGTLSVPRKEIQQRILDGGGKIVGSVSAKLNVLVAGEKAGSKLTKATNLGVAVWSEDDLNGQLETTTELRRLRRGKRRQTLRTRDNLRSLIFPDRNSTVEHGVGRRAGFR